jgi:hypothetical protein
VRKKQTPGERFVRKPQLADPSGLLAHSRAWRDKTARIIDAAIRRAQAAAWDKCYVCICESDLAIAADIKVRRDSNPYRKARRK